MLIPLKHNYMMLVWCQNVYKTLCTLFGDKTSSVDSKNKTHFRLPKLEQVINYQLTSS
jgi:hypothetical protein